MYRSDNKAGQAHERQNAVVVDVAEEIALRGGHGNDGGSAVRGHADRSRQVSTKVTSFIDRRSGFLISAGVISSVIVS